MLQLSEEELVLLLQKLDGSLEELSLSYRQIQERRLISCSSIRVLKIRTDYGEINQYN